MKRRNFLKTLSAIPIVAVIPAIAEVKLDLYAIEETTIENEGWGNPVSLQNWKAFLNGIEIPLGDCIAENGGISPPIYMKEGDIWEIQSPFIAGNQKWEKINNG